MQKVFLQLAPEAGPSSTPPGEGGNWEAFRKYLGGKGPEEPQRRLGLKKLIDFCSQMQKFLYLSILRTVFEGRYHELSIFTADSDGR